MHVSRRALSLFKVLASDSLALQKSSSATKRVQSSDKSAPPLKRMREDKGSGGSVGGDAHLTGRRGDIHSSSTSTTNPNVPNNDNLDENLLNKCHKYLRK